MIKYIVCGWYEKLSQTIGQSNSFSSYRKLRTLDKAVIGDRDSDSSRRKRPAMTGTMLTKYGIIGVGMMGREHLINLHHLRSQGVAVVCVADPHRPSQHLALDLAHSFNWPLKV